jgi:hypothetical protein
MSFARFKEHFLEETKFKSQAGSKVANTSRFLKTFPTATCLGNFSIRYFKRIQKTGHKQSKFLHFWSNKWKNISSKTKTLATKMKANWKMAKPMLVMSR